MEERKAENSCFCSNISLVLEAQQNSYGRSALGFEEEGVNLRSSRADDARIYKLGLVFVAPTHVLRPVRTLSPGVWTGGFDSRHSLCRALFSIRDHRLHASMALLGGYAANNSHRHMRCWLKSF